MAPPRFKTFSGGDLCRNMVNYFNCIVNSVVVSACSAALRTFRGFFFFFFFFFLRDFRGLWHEIYAGM